MNKTGPLLPAFATFLALSATPAMALSPNQKAEAEARSFLIPCHQPIPIKLYMCQGNQTDFIRWYVRAKAGDLEGMTVVADTFKGPWTGSPSYDDQLAADVGDPHSMLQACVWDTVRISAPLDDIDKTLTPSIQQLTIQGRILMASHVCGELPEADQTAARRRADALLTELHTAPARMPPDDWQPKPP